MNRRVADSRLVVGNLRAAGSRLAGADGNLRVADSRHSDGIRLLRSEVRFADFQVLGGRADIPLSHNDPFLRFHH